MSPPTRTADPVHAIADLLHEATLNATPISPVHALAGAADLAMAYAIQDANTRRAAADGRRRVGYKIGLTSRAVQRQLGVDQPDSGVLFADAAYGDGEPIPMSRLIQPKIEAEVALVLGRSLDMPQATVADVIRATDFVLPALEIVDSRIRDWKITLFDTVADNASSGVFVLGGTPHRLDGLDLARVTMSLSAGDAKLSHGRGTDCLGHPLNAAVWVARRAATAGQPLQAGDVILTGALGPFIPASRGIQYCCEISGLGSVSTLFN